MKQVALKTENPLRREKKYQTSTILYLQNPNSQPKIAIDNNPKMLCYLSKNNHSLIAGAKNHLIPL